MSNWVYDSDSDGKWMVYDSDEPDSAPVIARQVRSAALARQIAALPDLLAAVQQARTYGDAEARAAARSALVKAGVS